MEFLDLRLDNTAQVVGYPKRWYTDWIMPSQTHRSFAITRYLLSAVAAVCGVLLPPLTAEALAIPSGSFGPLCGVTGLCFSSGGGVLIVVDFLVSVAIPAIRMIFIGVGTLYVGWFALTMIVEGHDESSLTEQRKAFNYAAIGMSIVGLSSLLVATFAPSSAGTALIAPAPFALAASNFIDFIVVVAGTFLVFHIGLAGFRIIVLQGNESEIDKQKKSFFNGLLGVMILLTARVVVEAVMPVMFSAGPETLVGEIAGIAKFLLEIVAGLAIVSLLASGILFVVAFHNDTIKQRAKRILLSTIVMLIVVISSHALVSTFLA